MQKPNLSNSETSQNLVYTGNQGAKPDEPVLKDTPSEQKKTTDKKVSKPGRKVSAAEESKAAIGTGAYFQENLRKMQKIEVTGWENTLRGERNTIVNSLIVEPSDNLLICRCM